MKKMMMTLAIMASMFVMASTDVYTFKTSIKYPAIGKTAFVPKTTTVSGTLTISDADSTNATATLVVIVKATKQTYTLEATDPLALAVFGKKNADCSTSITFVNVDAASDGILELTFNGFGSLKTKKTGGCTPCGDTTEICTKIKKISGVCIGKYACPCGGNFIEWDGSCFLDTENDVADYCPIYGTSASMTLKSVDGKKW